MDYILKRKNVKKITLKVNMEGLLEVTAPFNVTKKFIDELVLSNREKIEEKMEEVKRKSSEKNKYFYLLGEKYEVVHSENPLPSLDQKKKVLSLNFKYKDEIISNIYLKLASDILKNLTLEVASKYSFKISKIRVKKMKTRWGSCNPKKGYINLNSELIRFKKEIIEYVIIHELCHLIHPNHSKAFHEEVEKYCPNYKEYDKVLRNKP